MTLILVESQGASMEKAEAFAWSRKWMGRGGMWTTERPFSSGSRSLPSFVLISREGKVLLKGHPLAKKEEIEESVAAEILKSGKPPEGMPKTMRTAWLDFDRGRYTRAFTAAGKVADSGKDDSSAAEKTLQIFRRRIESKLRRTAWMADNGYYIEAAESAELLVKSLKGNEEFEARARELMARLGSKELKREMSADRALARLEKKIMAEGLAASHVKQLEKFAKSHEGTKAAARAAYLASLAGTLE